MQKVELHRHLEGSLRFSTLLELAPQVGIEIPSNWQDQVEKFLVQTPMKDLAAVLNKFWMTQSVLASEEILSRIAFEAIEDAVSENIKILELRYSPTFIQKGHENLSFDQIHGAICKGVKFAQNLPIAVGLLGTIQRTLPIESAYKVCDFIIEHGDSFVGIDLADDEDATPTRNFAPVFKRAQKAGFPITIHSGESNTPTAPQNVIDAIQLLGAQRIGHGLQIVKNAEALDLVRRKHIPLEICITSNWLTNAISSLHTHPIKELIAAGVLVTLNSDDPGIFGIDLTNDYDLLEDEYGFTIADFDRANDIAAQASFVPLVKKQKHWPRPIHKI